MRRSHAVGRAGVARSARLLVILGSAFGIGVLARSVVRHEPEPRPPVITVAVYGGEKASAAVGTSVAVRVAPA